MPAYVLAAVRTPFGRFGGALAEVRPDDLAVSAMKAVLARAPALSGAAVDEVVWGTANGAGEENRNVGRMAALLAGLPVSVPGTTVNRLVLRERRERYGVAAICIGVGQGLAVVLENTEIGAKAGAR